MQALGMFACAIDAALGVARCLVSFKWPVLALLIVAPLGHHVEPGGLRPERPRPLLRPRGGAAGAEARGQEVVSKQEQEGKEFQMTT